MKISIFTTTTNATLRGDNYHEAIDCYRELADEVIVIDGSKTYENKLRSDRTFEVTLKTIGYKWEKEFDWLFIGEQFQRGYEACTGDWVIHCDLDFLFHNADLAKVRQSLRDYPNSPAVSFCKWQFILPDRYNLKSRLLVAVNKKAFGDRIKFNGGGDLCQPTLDGRELNLNEMPQGIVPFYNYEKLTKTKAQIMDDVGRMDRAYERHFGKYLYSGGTGKDEDAYQGWLKMTYGRFNRDQRRIELRQHPVYIQETIKNLTPEQFGYNGFCLIEGKVYA